MGINELRGTAGAPVWLRNYYEQIVRDEADLARIRAYIERNPALVSRAPRLPSGLRWNIDPDKEGQDEHAAADNHDVPFPFRQRA